MKRSHTYADVANRLALSCGRTIDETLQSRVDPIHGKAWFGTMIYVLGEWYRQRGELLSDLEGLPLVTICNRHLQSWSSENTIELCFTAMGLGMLGRVESGHPVLGGYDTAQLAHLENELRVRKRFTNNWEAFNTSLAIGRSFCFGDDPENAWPHASAILAMYEATGYFDDRPLDGNYNSYGCMSLDYILRAARLLPEGNDVRQRIIAGCEPHLLRYVELIRHFMGPHGEGWLPCRSTGVLGQLQPLTILEQALSLKMIGGDDAAWAREACRLLMQFMEKVFWSEDPGWFLFRDAHRSCYSYRTTLPMAWDLLRYFLQLEHYALEDEAANEQHQPLEASIQREVYSRSICLDPVRQCHWYVWSDGETRITLPVIGGPGWVSCDTLPRPMLPGLFEGVTGARNPVLCPVISRGGENWYPAWWAKEATCGNEEGWKTFALVYDHLVSAEGQRWPLPGRWVTRWKFRTGCCEREDTIELNNSLAMDSLRMEVLQPKRHPHDRGGYPIYTLAVNCEGDLPGLQFEGPLPVELGEEVRNYFSKPTHRWLITVPAGVLEPGAHHLRTNVTWVPAE
jgi:hypothetical protein